MRKDHKIYYLLFTLVVVTIFALSGCGGKSQDKVSKKIEKRLSQVEGYKIEATMTMKTGQEARNYKVNVWFKKADKDFYRVDLTNEEDAHQQTILKNEEGVFVLTPVLNKSFKFQSDWPENNGQPYLYQSLIQDIQLDKDAIFTTSDDHYVFKTKTNYMNSKHLPYQELYFDKKTYLPSYVKVLGVDEETLIEVTFNHINVNPKFSEADFNRESILGTKVEEETMADIEPNADFEVLLPVVTKGAELVETDEVMLADGKRVIMTFKGERNFTLIQERINAVPASTSEMVELTGELVNLGHSIGAVSNDIIEWDHQGTTFYLASEEMTMDELIEVASSIYGKTIK